MILLLLIFDERLWFLMEVFLKLGCGRRCCWASATELRTLTKKACHNVWVPPLLFRVKSTLSPARASEVLLKNARVVTRRGTHILTLSMIQSERPILIYLRAYCVLLLLATTRCSITARWRSLIWGGSVTLMTCGVFMWAGVRLSAVGGRGAGSVNDYICIIWIMYICGANINYISSETASASTASKEVLLSSFVLVIM